MDEIHCGIYAGGGVGSHQSVLVYRCTNCKRCCLQRELAQAARDGTVDEVRRLWAKVRQSMRVTDDKGALVEELCMLVAAQDAASDEQDKALTSVLEVLLLERGCVVTQPMVDACLDASPHSVNFSRAEFLTNKMNQVCVYYRLVTNGLWSPYS